MYWFAWEMSLCLCACVCCFLSLSFMCRLLFPFFPCGASVICKVFCCFSQLPDYNGEAVNTINITSVEHIEAFRDSNSDSVFSQFMSTKCHTYGAKTDTTDVVWIYKMRIFIPWRYTTFTKSLGQISVRKLHTTALKIPIYQTVANFM
jgi:hypothetical protein